jgi:hypothetical protein
MGPVMRTILLSLILVLSAACTKAESSTPPVSTTVYGKVTAGPTVTPAQILAQIDSYAGKPVRVEGTVAAVCQMRGCWMDVAGAGGEKIRIKVKDGEITFPPGAKGKKVIAEGVVIKIPADPAADSTASCGGEPGAEGGEHHDCSRPAGASARIDGTGATIIDS